MVLRNRAPAVLLAVLLLLVAAAAAGAVEVEEAALPMELYFSAAELARNAGYGEEPVSSVSMSGQVTCELCLQPGSDLLTFELAGSSNSQVVDDSVLATTDEYGNFTIDLPPHLPAIPNLEKACVVKVLQLPADSSCRLRHRPSAIHGLRLSSEGDGVRAYTAGVIRLQNSDTPSDFCVKVENNRKVI